jgi:hypothetical protein
MTLLRRLLQLVAAKRLFNLVRGSRGTSRRRSR